MRSTINQRRNERGNALFLILIAVALFAALSYAVTQTGRGGSGGTSREQGVLSAGQITDYPAGVRTTVQRMILTNSTTVTAANFLATTANANNVFDQSGTGGGAQIAPPPPSGSSSGAGVIGAATASPIWRFKAIPPVGSGGHFFLLGVNTDAGTAAANGSDAYAFLGVTSSVCTTINTQLGITMPANTATVVFTSTNTKEGDPATQDGGVATATVPTATDGFTINAGGQPFACFNNNGTGNAYYHAIIEN